MKIVFIINNKNNRGRRVMVRLDDYCQHANPGTVRLLPTLRKKHAEELATQAARDGCDFLIAVGGDGTLHEVINGLLKSKIPTNLYPAIGLLPYGSANDFARSAQLTKSVEALMEMIRSNRTRRIDLGKIILHENRETRYFINIAGIGLSEEVVQRLDGSSSILGAGFNYFRQILNGFFAYEKNPISCSSDEWHWQGKLLQMVVANGRYFGNGLCVAPRAKLSDTRFQVVIFGDLTLWDYLKNLGKLYRGRKILHPQAYYHTAAEVLLKSDEACGIEADGEFVGLAPATIRILPKAISFLLPQETS